ncbi:IclR family transcriptional regulator [uncultured Dysosmobacter sp.]|uniref:IclR family transcriptional regulator n=1 Tax=uncultured Dysosmobacter sp. TaxID=2591384 RepID=UPI002620330D|nr:IclR family transcriptional regulator [uncultured Dysosmobacter sp.]
MAEPVKPIAVLENSLRVLEFLISYPDGAPLNEIAKGVQLNKSTIYRILYTLRQNHYIIQNEKTSEYRLGNRFLAYSSFFQTLSIKSISIPFMQEFSDTYGYSTSLTILDEDVSLALAVVNPTQSSPIRVSADEGFRCPLYCCASGKIFLSAFSQAELEEYFRTHTLTSFTEHTISNTLALRKDLEKVMKRGYSIENMENENEIVSVSAPIYGDSGSLVAALTVMALAPLINEEKISEIGNALVKQALKISNELGYQRQ